MVNTVGAVGMLVESHVNSGDGPTFSNPLLPLHASYKVFSCLTLSNDRVTSPVAQNYQNGNQTKKEIHSVIISRRIVVLLMHIFLPSFRKPCVAFGPGVQARTNQSLPVWIMVLVKQRLAINKLLSMKQGGAGA